MTIDLSFRKLRAYCRLWKRRKTAKRVERANLVRRREEEEFQQRVYRSAVQEILMMFGTGHCGSFILDKVRGRVDRYTSSVDIDPQSKKDFLEHCGWWEIDISHSHDNYRKLSDQEIKDYVDAVME